MRMTGKEWWPETGLNRRRRPFQGRALPLSYLASVQTHCTLLRGVQPSAETEAGSTNNALQQLCQYINSNRSLETAALDLNGCPNLN